MVQVFLSFSGRLLFQQSAGTFNYLKDCVMGLIGQEATPDLMPDTLSALSALMVAQGQEAVYLKAARDKMKPAIVAKVRRHRYFSILASTLRFLAWCHSSHHF